MSFYLDLEDTGPGRASRWQVVENLLGKDCSIRGMAPTPHTRAPGHEGPAAQQHNDNHYQNRNSNVEK